VQPIKTSTNRDFKLVADKSVTLRRTADYKFPGVHG